MLMEWFLLCPPIEQVLFLLHMDAHTRRIRMRACVYGRSAKDTGVCPLTSDTTKQS